jgi:autotransporter-associated beta strand protein
MKKLLLILPTLLLILTNQVARAGSATWNLHPSSGDWNTAANWTPNTVPNGSDNTATFGASGITTVSVSSSFEINGAIFNPGASSFTITQGHLTTPLTITISGAGIINNSGATQNFIATASIEPVVGTITFMNAASAGALTNFTAQGAVLSSREGAGILFFGTASAGSASFAINGGSVNGATGAFMALLDDSGAGSGTFTIGGGLFRGAEGGLLEFGQNATGADGTFLASGGTLPSAGGGMIEFLDTSTAGTATFSITGGTASGAGGGLISFSDSASAGDGDFNTGGAMAGSASGGVAEFSGNSAASSAILVTNGGMGAGAVGGLTQFLESSSGGTARVEVFGNGEVDISGHGSPGLSIGSLEGDGLVFLGGNNLTVGSSALSTTFSGIIQDGGLNGGADGSLTKIGIATLTLSGANLYTAGTTVSVGTLVVINTTGSGTGSGAVQLNAGTLGGSGIVSGAVTVGTGSGAGAFLVPAHGTTKQATFTTQSALTLQADATYTYTFKAKGRKARADKVIANGVTINGAIFVFQGTAQGTLKTGLTMTAISNTAATPITGTFANLPDGAILTVNGNNFQASYEGGDGNDLTLTVVP